MHCQSETECRYLEQPPELPFVVVQATYATNRKAGELAVLSNQITTVLGSHFPHYHYHFPHFILISLINRYVTQSRKL
jgi:hypothetical protein